jgi:pimeloyl-ACP methyl ester carboxylesterase
MKPLCVLLVAASVPHAASAQATDTTFDSNGVPIHYVVSGAGEPIVLIHGWSASAEMWDQVRGELSSRYRVIAMDCRGHGRSGKPHEPRTYGIEMVNDVVRLLDHLQIQRAHVAGYSMGGSIALKLLETHPDRLLSVVSGASQGFRPNDDQWDSLVVKKLVAGVPLSQAMIEGAPPGTPVPSAQQRAIMSRMDATQDPRALGAQRLGNPGLYVDYGLLRGTRVPVLLIVGSRDGPERFAELREALPSATFVVIEGAGHGSATDRPEFVEALRSFFDRHPSGKLQ